MSEIKGKLFISAAFFLAGSSVVAARYVADTLGPFTITAMSLFFAVITALILGNKKMLTSLKEVSGQKWTALICQSLIGVFLFRVFLTFGLLHTSAAEAGILVGTTPAMTAVLTRVFLKEKLNGNKVAGIAATIAGMVVLQGFPFALDAFSLPHLFGNTLVLGAAACESAFVIITRTISVRDKTPSAMFNPVIHSGYVSIVSLVACFPLMLWENQMGALASLPVDGWIALAWYGGMVTIVAFACIIYGARACDGYTLAAFSGLIPVSALALSVLILGESIAVRHVIGCACIVLSILLMSRR